MFVIDIEKIVLWFSQFAEYQLIAAMVAILFFAIAAIIWTKKKRLKDVQKAEQKLMEEIENERFLDFIREKYGKTSYKR